jgi:NAD(P)-dependent dehydrogenase (short-subunit alcohol dehydrogenase family)
MPDPKIVLITGASSGNGQATARLLAQQGYRVFGTSRTPASREPLPRVELIALDVRSDESVAAGVRTVVEQAGRIDVLINNAGYELGGALEETTLDEAKGQFETNFFGVVRMVRAVLPMMRQQRRGQIIHIGSLAGLVGVPFLGMYSASKFALEGYTEALRHEVKPFNIRVSLVEPGFLRTPMMNTRQFAAHRVGEYDPWRQRALDAIYEFEEKGPGPEWVARAVLKVIESKAPRLRYVIGQQAVVNSRLQRFLPEGMFEQGVRRLFRLDAQTSRSQEVALRRQL